MVWSDGIRSLMVSMAICLIVVRNSFQDDGFVCQLVKETSSNRNSNDRREPNGSSLWSFPIFQSNECEKGIDQYKVNMLSFTLDLNWIVLHLHLLIYVRARRKDLPNRFRSVSTFVSHLVVLSMLSTRMIYSSSSSIPLTFFLQPELVW